MLESVLTGPGYSPLLAAVERIGLSNRLVLHTERIAQCSLQCLLARNSYQGRLLLLQL
jgi:hypothetical protein